MIYPIVNLSTGSCGVTELCVGSVC